MWATLPKSTFSHWAMAGWGGCDVWRLLARPNHCPGFGGAVVRGSGRKLWSRLGSMLVMAAFSDVVYLLEGISEDLAFDLPRERACVIGSLLGLPSVVCFSFIFVCYGFWPSFSHKPGHSVFVFPLLMKSTELLHCTSKKKKR